MFIFFVVDFKTTICMTSFGIASNDEVYTCLIDNMLEKPDTL
jgi:hypothetical protein